MLAHESPTRGRLSSMSGAVHNSAAHLRPIGRGEGVAEIAAMDQPVLNCGARARAGRSRGQDVHHQP